MQLESGKMSMLLVNSELESFLDPLTTDEVKGDPVIMLAMAEVRVMAKVEVKFEV